MKIGSVYTGRSMSQPVLYNNLTRDIEAEMILFNDGSENMDHFNFEYKYHHHQVSDYEIGGQTALWASQYRLRKKWRKYLKKQIDSDFDLLIGMNELATPTIDAAGTYNIPSLFFIRSLDITGQEMYRSRRSHIKNFLNADFGARTQYPFLVRNFKEYKRGMKKADIVVSNSEYVSKRLKEDFNVDSEVIYPPITLERFKVDNDEDGYIAMVNPRNTEKGGDIFFDIAESMPSEDFISAGVFRNKQLERRCENIDNLTHIGWCDDMKKLYRQAKLVLVPSRWNEAFGRVAAEAMVSGIPCVVSNRGGLPEIVGKTGEIVEEIESIPVWQDAIERALSNHNPEAQMRRVKRFSAEKQNKKFKRVINSIT